MSSVWAQISHYFFSYFPRSSIKVTTSRSRCLHPFRYATAIILILCLNLHQGRFDQDSLVPWRHFQANLPASPHQNYSMEIAVNPSSPDSWILHVFWIAVINWWWAYFSHVNLSSSFLFYTVLTPRAENHLLFSCTAIIMYYYLAFNEKQ